MKYIKICNRPLIADSEDKSGKPTGTYEVIHHEAGYVNESLWQDLKLFGNYSKTPEGIAEMDEVKKAIKNGIAIENLELPLMSRLIERAGGGLVWWFNMTLEEPEEGREDYSYIRQFVVWNTPSLKEWTPEHDERVKKLQQECDKMNEQ